ncbi:hypothetical protein [[Clostridium] fimetarium]|uniref:DUF4209 domain-containing protein n=1 Tax=[Clostridium] fimetarium TaxID=99656 RepID=A0A1I0R0E0_9FIRM|nr:hypothetical protein [[Clostridium] fimetarium]SEW33451.1 hypothetical protein SAMN05421659_110114 [[Clostridium] fimetarium]
MNVLELLDENNITFSLEYYGLNDLATGWEVKSIIEQYGLFEGIFVNHSTPVQMDYNEFPFYLFSKKICAMKELLPALVDETAKEKIQNLISISEGYFKAISVGDIIKYINADFQTIFGEESDIDAKHITLEFVAKYSGGISDEVFDFLAENYGYLLIDKYSDFEKVFEAKTWLFEKTIPSGSYSEVMSYRFDEVLNVYAHINSKKGSSLGEIVKNRINVLYGEMITLSEKLDDESIMQEEHKIRLFNDFLERIKHRRAPEFAIINKNTSGKLDDYLQRKGQVFSYEIPVEEILNKWNDQNQWEVKLLSLTHDSIVLGEDYTVRSRLDTHKEAKVSLMDLCSSNIVSDSYFTHSHQQNLNIIASVGTGTMMGILARDEMLQDYFDMMGSAIHFIEEKMELATNSLVYDYELMLNMISTIKANSSAGKEVQAPLCYSASMFMCGFMEKIMRDTYEYEARGKQYFSTDRATLGQLLSESNCYMIKIFGVDHIRNIMFFMGTVGEKQIGQNIRNSLAHLTGNIEKHFSIGFVAQIMWIFTDILNTVFGYYLLEHLKGGTASDQL